MATFEHLKKPSGNITTAGEEEAKRLLTGYCRNVEESICSLRNNPWAQLNCEGGTIRWNPTPEVTP